jgi:cytochrome P450
MAEPTDDPVRMPPAARTPKAVNGLGYALARQRLLTSCERRHGSEFTLDLPMFGPTVVVSRPDLVKSLFTSRPDVLTRAGNLGVVLGSGSTFSLTGDEHRARRKLLVPPFHGKRMAGYESIVEEETRREIASWPHGTEFATLRPMMRITLNAILRAVFGAEGAAFEELRELLPPWITMGAWLVTAPELARRDLGPLSPGGRYLRYRRRYDAIIDRLIADALADPDLAERGDVLSLMLQARYDDGTGIAHRHIADELLTLLVAGHETTATSLAWAVERLRRHPRLLARLVAETDAGQDELLQATIWEVQRTRSVIDGTLRVTRQRMRLGEWVIPEGYTIIVSAILAHAAGASYPEPDVFDPDRFVGHPPQNHIWIPFGGGVYRCIGAAFATMEMKVTLRTMLRELELAPTYRPGEAYRSRGVALAPGDGGRAVVHPRRPVHRREAVAAATTRGSGA